MDGSTMPWPKTATFCGCPIFPAECCQNNDETDIEKEQRAIR